MADNPSMPQDADGTEIPALIDPPPHSMAASASASPDARGSALTEAVERIPPEPPPRHASQQEFLWKTHAYINEYIRFSDSKAGVVITLSSGLLGLLYSAKAHELFITHALKEWSLLGWGSAVSFCLLFVSVLLGVWTVRPRLWTSQSRAFIFWGGIANHQRSESFLADFRALSDDDLSANLARHVFELSVVCASKYFWVSASIIAGALGGVFAGVVVALKP